MNKQPPGQVRIIGGNLRGSKLPVPNLPGLRPSGDRARETLFNWLQGELAGARVLDLFAGSGALGFEAVSRGAAEAWLVERDPAQARSLAETALRLKCPQVTVAAGDALRWLESGEQRFDVVFLDPPFGSALLQASLPVLLPRLAEPAWVYVEAGQADPFIAPSGWRLHRQGQTREARHLLFRTESLARADTLGGSSPGPGNATA